MKGVFCANFSVSRHGRPPCNAVWCADCYVPHPLDRFQMHEASDESGYVWVKPKDKNNFKVARMGDHLMTPFQCDFCLFYMLKGRDPIIGDGKDALLQCCIRRANLDAFWGRASSTVLANRRHVQQMVEAWELVGMEPTLQPLGPYPSTDIQGVGVAVVMLLRSMEQGKYGDYSQFATIRKLRSAFSNAWHSSSEGARSMATLGRDSAKSFLTNCPTQGVWFERFAKGCVSRMGEVVRQDLAMSIHVMLKLMYEFELAWQLANGEAQEHIASVALYSVVAFCGSFRGHEVFLLDLYGLLKYQSQCLHSAGVRYCMIPLLGKYKGEDGSRYHLTPLAATTKSGINLSIWVDRVCADRRRKLREHGPVFADRYGGIINPRIYEMTILDMLQKIKEKYHDVIPEQVNVYEDYGISRSFRRGVTTHARNLDVKKEDIDLMNRWRNVESAQGRKARMRMADHYSDISQMIPSLLRFSMAL
mmetsp:Transcript_9714/g.14043  ORF Transcript_9714/g.14043 Transcript_9714/m.14043 type:complete len:475 (-) Transcript_9714:1604-3028(-)